MVTQCVEAVKTVPRSQLCHNVIGFLVKAGEIECDDK